MRAFIVSLIALVLFSTALFATPKDAGCSHLNPKVTALILEYQELREKRRRLPPGTFANDVKAYDGRLHRVLLSLGVELGHPPYTRKIVSRCLGKPDAIRNHKEMERWLSIYNREQKKAGRPPAPRQSKRQYLVYLWRGWHDFLFFISEDGLIVDHGWWFAYE